MSRAAPAQPLRVGLLAYGLERPATGIGRYTVEIAKAIHTHHPAIQMVLLTPFDQTIDGLEDLRRIRLHGTRLLPATMTLGPAQLALTARRHQLDIVHDPAGIAPFLFPRWPSGVGRVVTIHDMVPFVHPETHDRLTNFLFHRYIPRAIARTDRVITVSDASKRDIERFYDVDSSRVCRVYCGIGEQFHPRTEEAVVDICRRYGIHKPYVLAVGALQARKNLESVLEAYARLRRQGLPHTLVLVGPKAWKSQGVFQRLHQLELDDDVQLTGFIDDRDLPAVYSGASCFIFPSLYEGFGLPPLEAMACGAPVVTSNTSSLPEVVGDAGLLVGPKDIDCLTTAISRVLTDSALASDLRNRGIARAKQFTWEAAALSHADLYRNIHAQAAHPFEQEA
jgi:glycosyltransferase involved in cell wall biosynthesis